MAPKMREERKVAQVSEDRLRELYQPIWNEFSGSRKADPRDYDDIMETREGRESRKALDEFWDNLCAQGVDTLDQQDFYQWVGECEHRRNYGEEARESETDKLIRKKQEDAFVEGDDDDDENENYGEEARESETDKLIRKKTRRCVCGRG